MTGYVNPLARAKGLGSAKHGVGHWWAQRVTAIALVPLTLWLVFSILRLVGLPQSAAIAWLAQPLNAVLMAGFVVAMFYHLQLGLQVVIEDYIHHRVTEVLLQLAVKFAAIGGVLACLLAIVRVALRSPANYG